MALRLLRARRHLSSRKGTLIMLTRNLALVAALALATFSVGCAAPTASEEETVAEASEQSLTNASIATSIDNAFEFFDGPKSSLTIEMRSATLPRAVRSAVTRERRAVFAKMAEEGATSSDIIHMNVYAVYTTPSKRTLAGYALWMHANTGSMGTAYLVGFNSRAAVVLQKNDSYQDDQDWE
jgi:hypothetical protein